MTVDQINAAYDAARREVNATGYGHWVSTELLLSIVKAALEAAEKVK